MHRTGRFILPRFFYILFALLITMCKVCAARSGGPFYFYHALPMGSESIFNPLTTIFNGGFGILQISNRSNRLADINFQRGIENVTYNLSHPVSSISSYGWKRFFNQEILPTSLNRDRAQYFPNYMLHTLGGGATLVMFEEWYRWHSWPHPRWLAFASWSVYHFVNEIVENNSYSGVNIDPISDMYVFNSLGYALFQFEAVRKYIGCKLQLRDWSYLSAVDPHLRTIENVGQNFVVKYELPFSASWQLIYHFGNQGAGGISYRRQDGRSLSAAVGLVADDLYETDQRSQKRTLTTQLVWTAGLFYDIDNSLLMSLILAGTKGYKVRLNIYPGMVRLGPVSPGFFINIREDNGIVAGVVVRWFPIGIAARK